MKKIRILALLLAMVFVVSACSSGAGNGSSTSPSASAPASSSPSAPASDDSSAQEPLRIGWYAPIVMDYFDAVKSGCERFAAETGAEIEYQFGTAGEGSQAAEDAAMSAMAANGIRNFLVYPDDRQAANASFQELKDLGCNIVNYGGDTDKPTPVSFYVGRSTHDIAIARAQKLVDDLGGTGNIITGYQDATDPNVTIVRNAFTEVFDANPGIVLIQELSNLTSNEVSTEKFADALSANYGKIDAIIVYGLEVTVGLSHALREYYENNPNAEKIYVFGSSLSADVIESVRIGQITLTTTDPLDAYGYIGCMLLARLREGWVPKQDAYYCYVPEMYVNADNIDTYKNETDKVFAEVVAWAEANLLEKPN